MSEFLPVKSESHKGYRVEDDGSLTIQFKNGAYNYADITPELRDEHVRLADLEATDNSNGKFFAKNIRQLAFKKLD